MTTSSATKDNPKGNKKAEKKAPSASSSIRLIMKYGGNTIGKKEGGIAKKTTGGMRSGEDHKQNTEKNNPRSGNNQQKESFESDEARTTNLNQSAGMNELKHGGKEEHMEIDGIPTDGDTTNQVMKWDDPNQTMGIDASIEDIVKKWEEQIMNLEKEAKRATTEGYKNLVEKKILEAQVMYKDALLHLSKNRNEQTEENGNGDDPKTIKEIIDLSDELDGRTRESNEEHEDMAIDKNDQFLSHEYHDSQKKIGKELENPNKTAKKVVFDIRRGMDTFAWGDESDDDTVTLQNQENTKDNEWQKVNNSKQSKNKNSAENNKSTVNPYKKLITNQNRQSTKETLPKTVTHLH